MLIGTLKKDKNEIPLNLFDLKALPVGASQFDSKITAGCCLTKKKKQAGFTAIICNDDDDSIDNNFDSSTFMINPTLYFL